MSVDLGSVMAIVVVRLSPGGDEIVFSHHQRLGRKPATCSKGDSVTAVIKATEVMIGKN